MNPTFNPAEYVNADELACYLSMENANAFESARKAGTVPAPDTVFQGRPYWSCETAKQLFAARLTANRQAFGQAGIDEADAPDPLRTQAVASLRLKEGREVSKMPKPQSGMSLKGWG